MKKTTITIVVKHYFDESIEAVTEVAKRIEEGYKNGQFDRGDEEQGLDWHVEFKVEETEA